MTQIAIDETQVQVVDEVKTKNQLVKTIDPPSMTLADWIALSEELEFKILWAYNAWIKATNVDLSQLSIEDWMKFAEALDRSDSWALARYKEHKS